MSTPTIPRIDRDEVWNIAATIDGLLDVLQEDDGVNVWPSVEERVAVDRACLLLLRLKDLPDADDILRRLDVGEVDPGAAWPKPTEEMLKSLGLA